MIRFKACMIRYIVKYNYFGPVSYYNTCQEINKPNIFLTLQFVENGFKSFDEALDFVWVKEHDYKNFETYNSVVIYKVKYIWTLKSTVVKSKERWRYSRYSTKERRLINEKH